MWTVGELQQRTLTGRVGLLPLTPEPPLPAELANYAAQLFSFHLQDFVRE